MGSRYKLSEEEIKAIEQRRKENKGTPDLIQESISKRRKKR